MIVPSSCLKDVTVVKKIAVLHLVCFWKYEIADSELRPDYMMSSGVNLGNVNTA